MATQTNYMVKVTDASLKDVRTALQEAGIEVRSILQVHKEDIAEPAAADEPADGE